MKIQGPAVGRFLIWCSLSMFGGMPGSSVRRDARAVWPRVVSDAEMGGDHAAVRRSTWFIGQVHFAESDALLDTFHPLGCPPAFVAKPFHKGGNEEHPNDGGV